MSDESNDAVNLALDFAEALIQRKYEDAYAMTSSDFIEEGGNPLSIDALRNRFEMIVPTDWVFVDMEAIYAADPPPAHLRAKHVRGPLAIMEAEDDWVEDPDVAFVYVSIADDAEGEGISFYVTREASGLKIREISFGRP